MVISGLPLLAQLQISYKSHQTAGNNLWNWKKVRIRQNSKIVKTKNFNKLGPKLCTPLPPPIFGRGNLSNPRLWHKVRVTSKLFMDPTNVIASDPQLWLLLAFFDILSLIVKFRKLFILWYFRRSLKVEYRIFEAFRAT